MVFTAVLSLSLPVIAIEEGGTETAEETTVTKDPKDVERKMPTREEMLERLNRILRNRQSIREAVPGMELVGSPVSGHVEYNGIRIEDLSDSALVEIMAKVIMEARVQQMKNMERIQKQLQNVQNLGRINAFSARSVPPTPVNIPKAYTPPPANPVPPLPPSPPKAPYIPPKTR